MTNDIDLQQLFDAAAESASHDDAFVQTALINIQRARRQRLIYRSAQSAAILTISALAAPYVAAATLTSAHWLLTETGAYLACACATIMTWRIARRAMV